jgi:thiosulfate dehydrogenase [quinone] large subunit
MSVHMAASRSRTGASDIAGLQATESAAAQSVAAQSAGAESAATGMAPTRQPVARGSLELRAARWLFRSNRASVIWLLVRLWLGWQWLDAGWQKLTAAGYSNWMTHSVGLQGFIAAANASWAHRAAAFGHPQVNYPWFLSLLNEVDKHAQLFSRIVTLSELAVGAGLLLGCLTGFAAAGAVLLNIMYITGGSAGPNGIFIGLAVLLVAAWRVAGYLGVDHYLLPATGIPGTPGRLFRRRLATATT